MSLAGLWPPYYQIHIAPDLSLFELPSTGPHKIEISGSGYLYVKPSKIYNLHPSAGSELSKKANIHIVTQFSLNSSPFGTFPLSSEYVGSILVKNVVLLFPKISNSPIGPQQLTSIPNSKPYLLNI